MADKKINTLQLKKFMEKQIEELDQINELKKELKKSDEDIKECTEYLNRMYGACEQVIKMCNEYDELEKAKAKKEADKIKNMVKEVKEAEKKEFEAKKDSEPVDIDDDDMWN